MVAPPILEKGDKEMKDLVKGFVRWLIIVLATLCVITWSVAVLRCQTPNKEPLHATQHKDMVQQEDEIRMMTVTVTDKNGNLVYMYRENGKVVEVTYLFWDDNSIIKDPSVKPPYQFKGCYLMLYCLQHKYIYWLQRAKCTSNRGGFFFSDKDP